MKELLRKLFLKIPYVAYLYQIKEQYFRGFEPGHFYSPIVNHNEILEFENKVFEKKCPNAIKLNENIQKKTLEELKDLYPSIPFKSEKSNELFYYFDNETYSYSDGIFLHLLLRKFKPKNIIEIGCGFSSAVMYDTNRLFFNGGIKILHIDPYPFHLLQAFGEEIPDRNFLKEKVQNVSIDIFNSLQENDILFIDSSHVSKCGSDLNHILFNVLPFLKVGVIIHFHDIFYPFEYPKDWIFDTGFHKNGFGWNEIYLLRSFLMFNDQFEIILWPNFLIEKNKEWFDLNMPLCNNNSGGSIWLQKK